MKSRATRWRVRVRPLGTRGGGDPAGAPPSVRSTVRKIYVHGGSHLSHVSDKLHKQDSLRDPKNNVPINFPPFSDEYLYVSGHTSANRACRPDTKNKNKKTPDAANRYVTIVCIIVVCGYITILRAPTIRLLLIVAVESSIASRP